MRNVPFLIVTGALYIFSNAQCDMNLSLARWSQWAAAPAWIQTGWWASEATRRAKCQSLTWSCLTESFLPAFLPSCLRPLRRVQAHIYRPFSGTAFPRRHNISPPPPPTGKHVPHHLSKTSNEFFCCLHCVSDGDKKLLNWICFVFLLRFSVFLLQKWLHFTLECASIPTASKVLLHKEFCMWSNGCVATIGVNSVSFVLFSALLRTSVCQLH